MLVAEKPFKWQGRELNRGDVVDPAPQGRTLYALLDQRKIAYADGRPSFADKHQSSFVGHACDDCDFVAVSASALDNHWKANHLSSAASVPPADAAPVSASPGAPEAGGCEPSSAPPAELSCPDCHRPFKGQQGLTIHRALAHKG